MFNFAPTVVALALTTIPLIQPNERIVVMGDSLTYQSRYTTDLETMYTLKHPTANVKWFSRGYSGFTALVAAANYVPDVTLLNPTMVIIEYGANDIGGAAWTQIVQNNYITGLTSIVAQLRISNPNLKIVSLSPPATDAKIWDRTNHGVDTAAVRNDSILRFATAAQTWAKANNVTFIDISQPLLDIWTATATQASWGWTVDGEHPATEGAMPLALLILKGLGENDGASTATVLSGSGSCSLNCTISNVTGDGVSTLAFDRLDGSLPFVIPANTQLKSTNLALGMSRLATHYIPGWSAFNDWHLTVTGLSTGMWRLFEDNVLIGAYSNTTLASGINMSVMPVDTVYAPPAGLQTASVMGRLNANLPPNGVWELQGNDGNEVICLFGTTAFINMTPAEKIQTLSGRNAFAFAQDAVFEAWRSAYWTRAQPVSHHWRLVRP